MTRTATTQRACAGLAGALALLASTAAVAEAPVSWWYEDLSPENQTQLRALLEDAFNAGQDEHALAIDVRGADLDRQLRIAMLAGAGPDVVYTPGPAYVAAMAQAGQLLPLDAHAAKLGWNDRLLPVFLDLGRYDGALYAIPKTYETLGLFYNATLFAENGWTPPKTIPELETLAEQMLAMDIVPFGAGNADWRPTNEHYVSIILNSVAGPENVAAALRGELPWTAEPFVAAIETLDRWWKAGYFGPDYFSLTGEQAFAQVATRDAGMAPTGTWNFQNVAAYFPANDAEAAFVGFPSAEGLPGPIYPLGIGSTFSIAASSENPDGAAAVIDFVLSDDFYGAINTVWQGEWNMPLRDLSKVELGPDVLPLYGEAMANLAAAVDANQFGYTTWTFLPPATNTYVVSGIEEVWLDAITVEDFLATLDETFQQELGEGKVPPVPAMN